MDGKQMVEKFNTNRFNEKRKFYQNQDIDQFNADLKAIFHTTDIYII